MTNWCGMEQTAHPIGDPVNGMATADILIRLAALAGHTMTYDKLTSVTNEIESLGKKFGVKGKFNGKFLTEDGNVHFILYSDQVMATTPAVPRVLEIDARMLAMSKAIKG
jgi:hypothetical protein